MYFIDKLHVYQDYPDGNLPRVGEELISRYSIEDGDLLRETVNPKRIEGSYTTKFSVRCDGTRVSVEANPSKWNRIDNLFGFQTFDDCIKLYNIELLKFGLPPFSKATNVSYQQTSKDGIYKRITNGASFREIDITRNLSVGKNNEHHFLRGLSSQCIGKSIMPHLYPDGTTLAWKTSIWYSKLYNKANEMQLPRYRKLIKKLNQEELDYRNKIINYCNDVGLIRDEKEFKQSFLNRNNLCDYGLVSEKDFLPYLTDIDNLLNKIEISTMEYEHISDILLGVFINLCQFIKMNALAFRSEHDNDTII